MGAPHYVIRALLRVNIPVESVADFKPPVEIGDKNANNEQSRTHGFDFTTERSLPRRVDLRGRKIFAGNNSHP